MTDEWPHPAGSADETPEQRHTRHRTQHERDLATLAAGDETGWWDEHGHPRTLARRLLRPRQPMETRDRQHASLNESLKLLPQKA